MQRITLLFPAVTALQPLNGIGVKPLGGAASIDVGSLLDKKAAVVFGTYAADFNAIEYGQRLRHYAPKLKERGVESLHLILNADEAASEKFVELLGQRSAKAICGTLHFAFSPRQVILRMAPTVRELLTVSETVLLISTHGFRIVLLKM